MTFQDRTGNNLNRKKIKIISQTPSEIIADIERADDPITEGTKINAAVFNTFQENINTAMTNAASASLNATTALEKATVAESTSLQVANQFNELVTSSEFLSLNYSSSPASWAHEDINSLPTMFGIQATANSNVKFFGDNDIKANIVVNGDIYGSNGQKKVAYESDLLDLIYPVGSIYMSVESVSPSSLFGGQWAQIQDTFLLASGEFYNLGSESGTKTNTVSFSNASLPLQIGCNSDGATIKTNNYYSSSGLAFQGATNYSMSVSGSFTSDESFSNGMALQGTQELNNMPPYLVVNVWKRIA